MPRIGQADVPAELHGVLGERGYKFQQDILQAIRNFDGDGAETVAELGGGANLAEVISAVNEIRAHLITAGLMRGA